MISFFILLIISPFLAFTEYDAYDEARASRFYDTIFEPQNRKWNQELNEASWNFETNITEENSRKMNEISIKTAAFFKESFKEFASFNWRYFKNSTLKRLFYLNSNLGDSALDEEKLNQINDDINEMTSIYSQTTVCDYTNRNNCSLQLDPEILRIMTTSRNYDELLHIWQQWHTNCGRPMKKIYDDYVSLSNEVATLNGFKDAAEMWMDEFDFHTFEEDVEDLWRQLKPYYQELHAYVRRKLILLYGRHKVRPDGPIPAHILGHIFGQVWTSLYDLVIPFPQKPNLDITETLKKQDYTVEDMYDLSDSFYKSLGLLSLPESFWKLSMLTKPNDREVVCHPSAWKFGYNDVRIKMCTQITMNDLFTIHHEMGHIQYFLQYQHQPSTFQESANSGFDEAIGDTMLLSVSTPKHLKKIGLLSDFEDDEEFEINFLMLKALDKIASLPFSLLVDKWRWKVFRGEINPSNYNSKWWELSKFYQGIEPAVKRTETDFDAGTKIHVASGDAFISYFISTMLEFQFHEALCRAAKEFDPYDPDKPLHKCDIYGNTEAGEIFGKMLREGTSKPWEDILEELTGSRRVSARSIINYFAPLFIYIQRENQNNNEYIGWREERRSTLKGLPLKREQKQFQSLYR